MDIGSAIVLILISISVCYTVMAGRVRAKSRASRFLGQVAGFLASLSITVPCFSLCADDIYRYCHSQYKRCSSIKRHRPSSDSDPIYYASSGDFAVFALLCAQEYARSGNIPDSSSEEILSFCQSNLILSKKITSGIPSPWDC